MIMTNRNTSKFINDLCRDVDEIRLYKKSQRASKIDHLKNEILILRQVGLSYKKIADWLKVQHGIVINESSIRRRVSFNWYENNDT